MGSINTDSTTINFNGANIKIATSGKGLIFADGTTLSSNTEITANLAQVVNLGNATSNTMILENTGKTIVSSGNIESNIITTIIRFQEGSELPDGQGITLENAANNGNIVSNVVQFSNGLVASSISGLDTLSFTSTNTTTPPLQLTATSLNDGVGALRIDSVEPDIYLNDTNGGFATVTFANNDVARAAFGRNSDDDFYLTVRDPSTNSGNWRNDTFVADSSTGDISMGYDLNVVGNIELFNTLNFTRTSGGCYFTADGNQVINYGTTSKTWYDHRFYFTNFARFYTVSGGVATERYRISSSGGANQFTGQHRNYESNTSEDLSDYIGHIVVSDGVVDSITIDDALPRVRLSSVSNSKNAFGVISSKESEGNTFIQTVGAAASVFEKDEQSRKVIINSVGEGAIWVCNQNGPIENGDYITTSNILGLGMKQDDDILHNYTVAKATMNCDFNPSIINKTIIVGYDSNGRPITQNTDELVPEYQVKTLEDGTIAAFIGCTYHCG